jgi:hypothetical protein
MEVLHGVRLSPGSVSALQHRVSAMAERGGKSAVVGEGLLKEVEEVFALWHKLRDDKDESQRVSGRA